MLEIAEITRETEDKVAATRQAIRELGAMVVAYSGGVDSSLLLKLAHDELGGRAVPVYITSPTMVGYEKAEAMEVAEHIGARVRVVDGRELADDNFCANTPLRCYHCRQANYPLLKAVADEIGTTIIVDGANLDDLGDYRPGRRAAKKAGVRSPLLEAGLTKAEIRAISRELGLPTWDKPSMPCLASRIPYGTPVTVETLRQVERAEAALREIGFTQLRVRHHGDVARIELPEAELTAAMAKRAKISAGVKGAGYGYVALDLDGFRSGSLNEGIAAAEAS
jgi:pyridinium-3,5-biscarboxylic acid mononucleotide sulfurtransferase